MLMKTLLIRGGVAAFLGLAVASMSAQTQSTTSSSTTYIEASKIVGNKVKSSDGQEVGMIKDVVLDRSTGCMAYTVVSSAGDGASASGGKMVAVPWSVYSPTSDVSELTVTVDRQRIYNAPVFDYARIDEYSRPEYITNVYSYYGVSPGAAVGVGVSGSTTTGATRTTGTTTATGATSGTFTKASTNPATAASSPATSRTHTAAASNARGRGETGSRSEREPSRREGARQAESDTVTGEPRSEREQSRAERSSRAEGGAAPRESRSEREQSQPEGASQTAGGRATRESGSEREQSRPERSSQADSGAAIQEPRSERDQSRPERATEGQTQTGTHHHEKTGKHQTSSPPERPEGE